MSLDSAQAPDPIEGPSGRTLKELITAYCDSLARDKKVSAKSVRYVLTYYVVDKYPDLCQRHAASLKASDFTPIFESMILRGIRRTTATIRSYLRAAYQAALGADNNPLALADLKGFGLNSNPIATIPAMNALSTPGERALSRKELGAYVRAVRAIPFQATRAALLVALFLGGQRIEQLLRVQFKHVDADGHLVTDVNGREVSISTVLLRDPKGRREKPRDHLLPLFGEAESLIKELRSAHPNSPWVFTSNGKKPTNSTTLSHAVHEISQALLATNKVEAAFRLADIRRTCETHLGKMKVSKDLRAHIQSHGLGGIQDRHYDKNDYLDEKFQALSRWVSALAEMEAELAVQPG